MNLKLLLTDEMGRCSTQLAGIHVSVFMGCGQKNVCGYWNQIQ